MTTEPDYFTLRARYDSVRGGVRFAPSPTGRFHLGNLRSGWLARGLARAAGLPLVFRFEDIDRPRTVAGARERQLADLAELDVRPAAQILQTAYHDVHAEMFWRAARADLVYPCFCSRREVQDHLADLASAPHAEPAVYDGHCRAHDGAPSARGEIAWRFRDPDDPRGRHDVIVARSRPPGGRTPTAETLTSFQPAYQWACAVDDWFGEHELLVRAWDLEWSTPPQRRLQSAFAALLNVPERFAAVYHASLVVHDDGRRLEKRSRGVTLAELRERWSVEQILEKFQASTDESAQNFGGSGKKWAAGIGGEKKKQLTLSELGFKPL